MSFEFIGAVGAVLLVLAIVWLRGGYEVRRAASVIAIVTLAIVTTTFILAPTPNGPRTGTSQAPSASGSLSASASPSGVPSPSSSAGSDPSVPPMIVRHEVSVRPGNYTVFMVDVLGTVTAERAVSFDQPSMAPVDRVQATNGLIHWRTVVGGLAGWSYVPGESGPFIIRAVLRLPDGSEEVREVDPES